MSLRCLNGASVGATRVVVTLVAPLALVIACEKAPHAPQSAADGDHGHAHEAHAGDAHVDEVHLTAEAIAQHGVTVEVADESTLRPTLVAPARVAFDAEAMAHVGSPLRGRIAAIPARLGDSVRAGDVLAVVESPELGEAQADFLQKRVAAQTCAPGVELAKVAWERAKSLYEQSQGISLADVQRREAEHRAAIASQRAAESAALAAENRLHLLGMTQAQLDALSASGEIDPRHEIRAAIDGRVVEREVTLGELVGPDRESIMVLADTSKLWVLADVSEASLAKIAIGAAARVNTGADDAVEGRVAWIAPLVDASTRTVPVRVEVTTHDARLKPGMFASVELALTGAAATTPMIVVPEEAIQMVEGRASVFVPVDDEPNTFAVRRVAVGPPVGGLVPVRSGLERGERFVRAGSFILKAELGKSGAAHEH